MWLPLLGLLFLQMAVATETIQNEFNISIYHGFLASLSVVILSELGDKTWFIAVIMAMRHSRLAVFSGAMGANILMTGVSSCLGWVTILIPHSITNLFSTALFTIFGLKMLHEGYKMSASEAKEEFDEAQEEVTKRELLAGKVREAKSPFFSTFLEAFSITFLSEWGDRSQLTTIALGAKENMIGVISGGIMGHAICTGIAVIGGQIVAERISVRAVTVVGGLVFLTFALTGLIIEEDSGKEL